MSEQKCPCTEMTIRKLKVLMIHGYRQNAEVFRQKTGSFRKMLHKWAEFTYVTAPHRVLMVPDLSNTDDVDIQQSQEDEQYGWFFNREDMTFRGIRKGGPAIGFEESVQYIEDVFEKEGPFDGIIGFSQGACFLGLLCDMQQRGLTKCRFKFAVLASGFKSGSLPHANYYKELISLPSLHIYGENDQIIPTSMSEDLMDCFEDGKIIIVTHPGGHYLPAASPQKHKYQNFFKVMLAEAIKEEDQEEEEESTKEDEEVEEESKVKQENGQLKRENSKDGDNVSNDCATEVNGVEK